MKKSIIICTLTVAASALIAFAQAPTPAPSPSPSPLGKHGKAGHEKHHPRSPIVAALDANGDGVIDAQEIANAPAALRTLDKNGDGQLTRDEFRRPREDGNRPPKGERKHRNRKGAETPVPTPSPTPVVPAA